MMTTQDLFEKIRKAPAMYLTPPSAKTLRAFLTGYEFGLHDSASEFSSFSADFGNWLRKRYNLHSSQHWTKIIEFYSSTESEEMDLFWKLYDEFESIPKRKKNPSADRTATVQS